MTFASMRIWGFIAGVGAGVPTVLGGCSVAFDLYMDRISAAHGPQTHGPRPNPTLEDNHAYVREPLAMTSGPAVSQLLSPADRQYLLDRFIILVRRRFPRLVVAESRQAAIDRRFATILELDVVQEQDEDAMARFVLRVWSADGRLASIIQGQLYDIDARRGSRRKVIDDALPLMGVKVEMLVH